LQGVNVVATEVGKLTSALALVRNKQEIAAIELRNLNIIGRNAYKNLLIPLQG